MKSKYSNIIWGIVLIAAGLLFLAQNLGWIPELAAPIWTGIFLAISIVFLILYVLGGWREWGWLFPASIFAGLALTIFLAERKVADELAALPVLLSVALPFLVAFLVDRQKNWWALIPSWVMLVIVGVVLLGNRISEDLIAAMILGSIALPFLVVYFLNRQHWWALIPGGVLIAVGLIPLLAQAAQGEWIAAYVMLAIAVPFMVVYAASRQNWWALIPAGIMLSIGLMLVLIALGIPFLSNPLVASEIMLLGFAATFGVLWLLRARHDTAWAKYPAIGLVVTALGTAIFGANSQLFWAIALIIGGGFLLALNLRKKPEA